jgi:succinyl-diaminopimelate desuccinylase
MPNGVGFGIIPTSEPSLAHQANESFNLDNYDTGMHLLIAEILALADNL